MCVNVVFVSCGSYLEAVENLILAETEWTFEQMWAMFTRDFSKYQGAYKHAKEAVYDQKKHIAECYRTTLTFGYTGSTLGEVGNSQWRARIGYQENLTSLLQACLQHDRELAKGVLTEHADTIMLQQPKASYRTAANMATAYTEEFRKRLNDYASSSTMYIVEDVTDSKTHVKHVHGNAIEVTLERNADGIWTCPRHHGMLGMPCKHILRKKTAQGVCQFNADEIHPRWLRVQKPDFRERVGYEPGDDADYDQKDDDVDDDQGQKPGFDQDEHPGTGAPVGSDTDDPAPAAPSELPTQAQTPAAPKGAHHKRNYNQFWEQARRAAELAGKHSRTFESTFPIMKALVQYMETEEMDPGKLEYFMSSITRLVVPVPKRKSTERSALNMRRSPTEHAVPHPIDAGGVEPPFDTKEADLDPPLEQQATTTATAKGKPARLAQHIPENPVDIVHGHKHKRRFKQSGERAKSRCCKICTQTRGSGGHDARSCPHLAALGAVVKDFSILDDAANIDDDMVATTCTEKQSLNGTVVVQVVGKAGAKSKHFVVVAHTILPPLESAPRLILALSAMKAFGKKKSRFVVFDPPPAHTRPQPVTTGPPPKRKRVSASSVGSKEPLTTKRKRARADADTSPDEAPASMFTTPSEFPNMMLPNMASAMFPMSNFGHFGQFDLSSAYRANLLRPTNHWSSGIPRGR